MREKNENEMKIRQEELKLQRERMDADRKEREMMMRVMRSLINKKDSDWATGSFLFRVILNSDCSFLASYSDLSYNARKLRSAFSMTLLSCRQSAWQTALEVAKIAHDNQARFLADPLWICIVFDIKNIFEHEFRCLLPYIKTSHTHPVTVDNSRVLEASNWNTCLFGFHRGKCGSLPVKHRSNSICQQVGAKPWGSSWSPSRQNISRSYETPTRRILWLNTLRY